jgi:hypothetical protein
MRHLPLLLLLLGALLLSGAQAFAFRPDPPEECGMAINLGARYDPAPSSGFVQLSLMARYDYEQILPHRAPEPLKFKIEASLGVAADSRQRAFASVNFFALYFLDSLASAKIKPYVEAGAGIIYSDFQVDGQGLRINFNPQAGIGAEFAGFGRRWYGALRGHHVSNGHLYRANRGMNSLLLQVGRLF